MHIKARTRSIYFASSAVRAHMRRITLYTFGSSGNKQFEWLPPMVAAAYIHTYVIRTHKRQIHFDSSHSYDWHLYNQNIQNDKTILDRLQLVD